MRGVMPGPLMGGGFGGPGPFGPGGFGPGMRGPMPFGGPGRNMGFGPGDQNVSFFKGPQQPVPPGVRSTIRVQHIQCLSPLCFLFRILEILSLFPLSRKLTGTSFIITFDYTTSRRRP